MIGSLPEVQVVFVGGKGGVGKTTIALALSLLLADRGKRCLVVSTDPAHSLGDACGRPIGDRVTAITAGVWGLEIDPDATARDHTASVTERMKEFAAPEMHREVERQMALAALSPGAVEAALLERVAELMLEAVRDYDVVIFDTAPTGHTLRLLTLPEAMAAWTDGLLRHTRRSEELGQVLKHLTPGDSRADVPTPFDDPQEDPFAGMERRTRRVAEKLLERRRLFHQARRALQDPSRTALIFVLTPEKLPVLETRRALEALERFGLSVCALVVNRVLPAEAEGDFFVRRRRNEQRYLEQVSGFAGEMPVFHVPFMPEEIEDLAALNRVAACLGKQR